MQGGTFRMRGGRVGRGVYSHSHVVFLPTTRSQRHRIACIQDTGRGDAQKHWSRHTVIVFLVAAL